MAQNYNNGMFKYRAMSFVKKRHKKTYEQIILVKIKVKNTKIIIEQ